MSDERTEIAIEAAAKAFHYASREMQKLPWDQCSEKWRHNVRFIVRPIVEAALTAADAYVAFAAAVGPRLKH